MVIAGLVGSGQTTQSPAASAGEAFIPTSESGPFHGVSSATTPYGSEIV
jgi:hypothetical protein